MSTTKFVTHVRPHAWSYRAVDGLKRRLRGRLLQVGVVAWAAFWAWFFVADSLGHYIHEGDWRALAVMAVPAASTEVSGTTSTPVGGM